MISGARVVGKKIIFIRTIYVFCNKEDTKIWHLRQGHCDLKTEKTETPTSIHLINVAPPPTQILHCFPFSSALQRKEQTLQRHTIAGLSFPFFCAILADHQ